MPAEFSRQGISFQYPENWSLDEDDILAGQKSVTVFSPDGAFWTVSLAPSKAEPLAMAAAAVEAMKEEYEELETEQVAETIAGHDTIGFDLNFYYLDLTNTARIRCLRTDRATYTFFCQAEDQEFERIKDVFLAMTTSALMNVKQLKFGV